MVPMLVVFLFFFIFLRQTEKKRVCIQMLKRSSEDCLGHDSCKRSRTDAHVGHLEKSLKRTRQLVPHDDDDSSDSEDVIRNETVSASSDAVITEPPTPEPLKFVGMDPPMIAFDFSYECVRNHPRVPLVPNPRTASAECWKFFGFTVDEYGAVGTEHAYCGLCLFRQPREKVYHKFKVNNGTHSMNEHLSRRHRSDVSITARPPTEAHSMSTWMSKAKPLTSQEKSVMNDAVAFFIASSKKPLSVVSDRSFRYLLRNVQPRFSLPSRTTITEKLLPALANRTQAAVREHLVSAVGVGITTDGWTKNRWLGLEKQTRRPKLIIDRLLTT